MFIIYCEYLHTFWHKTATERNIVLSGRNGCDKKTRKSHKPLLEALKEKRVQFHLMEEALDRTMSRNSFRGGFGPVVRQNTE
jgi:hypothetical protein